MFLALLLGQAGVLVDAGPKPKLLNMYGSLLPHVSYCKSMTQDARFNCRNTHGSDTSLSDRAA